MEPDYITITASEIDYERRVAIAEGRDFDPLEKEYSEIRGLLESEPVLQHQDRAREFFDQVQELPIKEVFPYQEPNELEDIRDARPEGPRQVNIPDQDEELFDRIHGAWLGRCSGCLLGRPIEGWSSDQIWGYLKDQGKYPLREYFRSDVSDEIRERYNVGGRDESSRGFVNKIDHMVRDDDIDYPIMALSIMGSNGTDFTSEDVVEYWLENLPGLQLYVTARVAYRNFMNLVLPPESATHRNPYREAIGAQIRADSYGYSALGDPERAAELAWRDARISHTKNGIYGSMWVAAMLAAAPSTTDPREVVQIGLSEIPAESRFTDGIQKVIDWKEEGIKYEEAMNHIHREWDDEDEYSWRHVISNAQIVTIGLLWGRDFEESICCAVQCGFDVDCNGATVGSVYGMMNGADTLPSKWIEPLQDRTGTVVYEYAPTTEISALAEESFNIHQQVMG